MLRGQDLFEDKPMSFGDHLEDLRVHLVKALIGAAIGITITLFIGHIVVGIVRQPIDAALIRRGLSKYVTEDIGQKTIYDFFREWMNPKQNKALTGTDDNPPAITDYSKNPAANKSELLTENEVKLKGDMLDVEISVQELSSELHTQFPGSFPEPQPETSDRKLKIKIHAPEFAMFREAALRGLKPVALNVQEPFLVYLKVSMVSGVLLASPWIFYQVWMFVAVGLYQHERKYVYYFGGVSMLLFTTGALFCFYFVFPVVLDFLLTYNDWLGVEPQIRLSEWVNFSLLLPIMFGISFQLPLVMVFLEKLQIVEAKDYTEHRRMAILVISIVSMVLTPSDPWSMLMMMFPLLILYELGILFCKYTATSDPFANPKVT
jgi:sec-independent protein translocase protein TatC